MVIVGIGEYAISNNPNEYIITHALGSCVALILHCPYTKYTALAHIVLPEKTVGQTHKLRDKKSGYFAEDIVPKLIDFFLTEVKCNRNNLHVHMIGGAQSKHIGDVFQVGRRNAEKVNYILNQYQLQLGQVDIGGNVSRTVRVDVNDGTVQVKKQQMII